MATNCSTAFRSLILGPTAFESIFNGGCIEIRSEPQPASADLPAAGTLLARITAGGGPWSPGSLTNGLRFNRTGFYATNDGAQDWRLTGLASGTARWFRLVANAADPGLASVTHPRVDGAIGPLEGEGDYQMRLPVLAITPSTVITIPSWWFVLPPLN